MNKRIAVFAMVASVGLGLLGGCGESDEGTATGNAIADTSASTTEELINANVNEDVRYAVILKTQASDFWVKMKKGIEEKADELGIVVDIYAAQSEQDLEGQLDILTSCIDKGYDGIAVAPLSSTNLISGVVLATEAGIPVVNIDEKLDVDELAKQGGAVVGFVTTDNIEVGRKGAAFIAENVEVGSKVAIIEGLAENQSGIDRTQGATEVFVEAGLNVCASAPADWDRQKAMEAAAAIIEQTPDLKAIYCCNDTMALGALQAVINADMQGEILVVGTDGDTEAIESVNAGGLTATVAQDPAGVGVKSLELLIQAVQNGNIGSVGRVPEITPVDSRLISK